MTLLKKLFISKIILNSDLRWEEDGEDDGSDENEDENS